MTKIVKRAVLNPNKGLTEEEKIRRIAEGDFSFAYNDGNENLFSKESLGNVSWDSGWDIANMMRYSHAAIMAARHVKHKSHTVKILDIGSSAATFAAFWAWGFCKAPKPHLHYRGLEVSADVVDKGNEICREIANGRDRLKLSVHTHDLELQSLPTDWVPHVILAQEIIEHISKEAGKRMLEESFALLPEGGKMFLSTPNPKKPEQQFVWPESHVYEYALDELLPLVESVGFEVKAVNGWFSQQEDRKTMSPEAKELFKRLNEGPLSIASTVIGFLYPECAKGVCLTLRKPGKLAADVGYGHGKIKE